MFKKDKKKDFALFSKEVVFQYLKKTFFSQLGCCSCKFFSCVQKTLGSNLGQISEQPV